MIRTSKQHARKDLRLHKLTLFIKKNYLLFIFIGCLLFVGLVAFYKLYIVKPTYIYVKVKVGQGLWWANTQKPNLWFVNAIKTAKEKKDITGKTIIKITDVSYYPYYGTNQYDIYIVAQLLVSKVGNTGGYNFNREAISVGMPIELEFPHVSYSGTVITTSTKPIRQNYTYKTISLYKRNVNPWEYEQIQRGDSFVNGKDTLFLITDKEKGETIDVLLSDVGKMIEQEENSEKYRYVKIKAKIRLNKIDNQYFYGDEMIISPGRYLGIVTEKVMLNDYIIMNVE